MKKGKNRLDNHMWTSEEVKKLYALWSTTNIENICKELGLTRMQVVYMAHQMRKAGFVMPRKHRIGRTQIMLQDVKKELNIR